MATLFDTIPSEGKHKKQCDVTYRVRTFGTWSQKVFDFEGRRLTPPRIGKSRKKKQRKKKKPALHDFCQDALVVYLESEYRKSLEVKCMYLKNFSFEQTKTWYRFRSS